MRRITAPLVGLAAMVAVLAQVTSASAVAPVSDCTVTAGTITDYGSFGINIQGNIDCTGGQMPGSGEVYGSSAGTGIRWPCGDRTQLGVTSGPFWGAAWTSGTEPNLWGAGGHFAAAGSAITFEASGWYGSDKPAHFEFEGTLGGPSHVPGGCEYSWTGAGAIVVGAP